MANFVAIDDKCSIVFTYLYLSMSASLCDSLKSQNVLTIQGAKFSRDIVLCFSHYHIAIISQNDWH